MNVFPSVCAATRRILTLAAVAVMLPAWAQAAEIEVGQSIKNDTSVPLREMAPAVTTISGNKEIPILLRESYGQGPDVAEPDGGVQGQFSPGGRLAPTPAPIVNAPGLSEQDNRDVIGNSVVPPDTNGDIGLDDNGNRIYIQYINLVWGIFNDSGTLIAGPFAGNTFWDGFGGACELNNDGDPVVLYDDLAGRWFFSQFSVGEGIQCVAVSVTSDPLGPYHRYAFQVSPNALNDYPKLGVWDDGGGGQSAYTFTVRDFLFGVFFQGVGAGVMERDAMLAGLPAKFVKFTNPCVAGDCVEGQLPPHLAGQSAPSGACPVFWTAADAQFDDTPWPNDGYRNHRLCVDWSNTANSTYTEGTIVPAGTEFNRSLGNISPIAGGGDSLDSLPFFTMYRAQYRWFDTYASVVLNTTVDADPANLDRAGIRWAEVRSGDGDSGWFLQQDGTYAPDDGKERWMGSIAQDGDGNIALGYSVASGSLFPSVAYTSRMAGDATGEMPGGEVTCHTGTGAQTGADRWGDYSSMSIDPTDDCTFWFTQEYYETTGSFDFSTRICSFRFPDCGEPPPPPPTCESNEECADTSFCNGAEICNAEGLCEPGTPVVCDDGVACTVDSCNEGTNSCDYLPDNTLCDDGLFCNGDETCDAENGCEPGTPVVCNDGVDCTVDSCNEGSDSCDYDDICPEGQTCDEEVNQCIASPCNNNGICETGEDCDNCADCPSGPDGPICGNGVCEPTEDCLSCAADCAGKQSGKPGNRYCCSGDGVGGENPVDCNDARCTAAPNSCSSTPVPGFCCGDGFCDGSAECEACGLDCGGLPICDAPVCSDFNDKSACNAQATCSWDNRNKVCLPN